MVFRYRSAKRARTNVPQQQFPRMLHVWCANEFQILERITKPPPAVRLTLPNASFKFGNPWKPDSCTGWSHARDWLTRASSGCARRITSAYAHVFQARGKHSAPAYVRKNMQWLRQPDRQSSVRQKLLQEEQTRLRSCIRTASERKTHPHQ